MNFKELLDFLKETDGGDKFASNLVTHIEEVDTLKTENTTLKKQTEAIGDRDLGKIIGMADYLEKENLNTAEQIVELRNKADGGEKTASELQKQLEDANNEIKKGTELVDAKTLEVDAAMLLVDAKTSLMPFVGDRKRVFDTAITTEMAAGKFSKNDKGETLFENKPIAESLEYFRTEWGNGFDTAPEGTGNAPSQGDQHAHQHNNQEDTRTRLNKMFQ